MAKIEFSAGIEELRLKYGVNKIKMRSFLKNCPPMEDEQGYLDAITAEYGDDLAPDYDVEEPYDDALGCIGEEMIGGIAPDIIIIDDPMAPHRQEAIIPTLGDDAVFIGISTPAPKLVGFHPITGKEVYL